MRYDVLLRERLHGKGSLRNMLLGPSPRAIVVLGAARVAGTAAVLQGWPLSAEGFWCPCGSYGTRANPPLCPSKCKFIGCRPGSAWCRSGCCQVRRQTARLAVAWRWAPAQHGACAGQGLGAQLGAAQHWMEPLDAERS